ncbi:hypothetical protein F4808DRAFT_62441 [Astrocystis sublimbata]|nr:hypothetical protein F4808DRAFT_62441 [Astrocystis sublimbata]
MGNTQSQSQNQPEESDENRNLTDDEFSEPDFPEKPSYDTLQTPVADEIVFSSQINSSMNPANPAPRHFTKIKQSPSSPTSLARSSRSPTPIPNLKMSLSSPAQSSPAIDSSIDLDPQSNEPGTTPHLPKWKKKRSKKHRDSPVYADEPQEPLVPQVSSDPQTPAHDGERQSDEGSSRSKRERKKRRRAEKLAKQQAEATAATDVLEEPSPFAEIWNSQEQMMVAKREREEPEEHEVYGGVPHEELPSAKPKKRKRKSHTDTERSSPQVSKKPKSFLDGIMTADEEVEVEEAAVSEQAQEENQETENKDDHMDDFQADASHELPETSNNNNINLNDLAEQLYSGRKQASYIDAIEGGESISAVGTVSEQQDFGGPMDIDTGDTNANQDDSNQDESNQDDSNHSENASNPVLPNDIPNGVTPDDMADAQEQNGTYVNGTAPGDVEVPSSIPHPSNVDEPSAKQSAKSKSTTGRKRVAKPDYFSRMVDNVDADTSLQSPSSAALSRRNGKDKQIAVADEETEAGPSTTPSTNPRRTKQLKNNTPLDISLHGDSNVVSTPINSSVRRMRKPATPATTPGSSFTDMEHRGITQAIEQFRDDYDMTQHAVNGLIQGNPRDEKARELWERVMALCPERGRQKVINQTRRRFHNFVARGTWTPEQDQELRSLYELHGNKHALLGQLVNRHAEDVRDRIRNYIVCGDNQRKDTWTKEETDRLVAVVEHAQTEIRRLRSLPGGEKDAPIEDDMDWQLVSRGMNRTRSRLQCIAKWKAIKPRLAGGGLDGESIPTEEVIQQARDTAVTMSYRNRCLIVQEVLKRNINADSRIPWLKVRNALGDKWTRPPLMVVWYRLRRSLEEWQGLNVKEVCTLLLQRFQHTRKLDYPSEESGQLDLDAEYREIEYRIKKGRRVPPEFKSESHILLGSDNEGGEEAEDGDVDDSEEDKTEEALHTQLTEMGEEAGASRDHRSHSPDLGVSEAVEERVIEDSEPETAAGTSSNRKRRSRSGRARSQPKHVDQENDDEGSSDTNASQVSSIPARLSLEVGQ